MPTKHQSYWDRKWKPLLALLDNHIARLEAIANQPLGSKEQRLAKIKLADCATIRTRIVNMQKPPK